MPVKLVKSCILFEDLNRAVKSIIQRDTGYDVGDYTFDELDYEYVDGEFLDDNPKLIYKIDWTVHFSDGEYGNYRGRVDESEVIQFLREEKLNGILNDEV